LSDLQVQRLRKASLAIAQGIGVRGLINVQYAIAADTIYVIEANPRASRTVPFASKATGIQLARAAARIMCGETISQQRERGLLLAQGDATTARQVQQVAVKQSVLPFKRFRMPRGSTLDMQLGPEMHSTGEVMGFDRDFPRAFAKSQMAAYAGGIPTSGNAFISVNDEDKRNLPILATRLYELGFEIWATKGSAAVLAHYNLPTHIVGKVGGGAPDDESDVNVLDLIKEGMIDMVVNTPSTRNSREDGYKIRSAAIAADLPLFTTLTEFSAALFAIEALKEGDFEVMSLQEHAQRILSDDVRR
jgi:carbamoyl-phosphate synthase large subunit